MLGLGYVQHSASTGDRNLTKPLGLPDVRSDPVQDYLTVSIMSVGLKVRRAAKRKSVGFDVGRACKNPNSSNFETAALQG